MVDEHQAISLAFILVVFAILFARWYINPLRHLPTVGGTSVPGLSYLTAFYNMFHAMDTLGIGFKKFYGSTFKFAMLDQWVVIVSGPNMIDELRRRLAEELSHAPATDTLLQLIQLQRFLGRASLEDTPHVHAVEAKFTRRSVTPQVPVMVEELELALEEYLQVSSDAEWTSVHVLPAVHRVVTQVCSHVFVGSLACRDSKFVEIAAKFPQDIIVRGYVLSIVPHILKPILAPWLNIFPATINRALPYLKPTMEERRFKLSENDHTWDDKPDDILQWLIENAEKKHYSDSDIVESFFMIHLAATYNTSNSLTHALYHLAARPELLAPLREEIDPIVVTEGWTASSISKMEKLDSFLRESQRHNGVGMTSMIQKAMKDVTLNDGSLVPRGTLVHAVSYVMHHSDTHYPSADEFDPFRFSRMRALAGECGSKYQFASTSPHYIPFGHGQHTCPGRFFVANQMKIVVAYIVMRYDLKLGRDGKRPPNFHFTFNILPAPGGRVLFRARQDE
ncbi:cytochrome P450 [Ganoderma leucocontextum]|nr:cytochrome P450 [Ganoderma leucocontextum]